MKVAITGHTKGIGLEIANYFTAQGAEVLGFSKSTGYDVSDAEVRTRILEEIADCDVFVNNAWTPKNNGQLRMLEGVAEAWSGKDKMIINVSSRASDSVNDPGFPWRDYARLKKEQDMFCQSEHKGLWVLNLKPGNVNTAMTLGKLVPKMEVSSISNILEFVLGNKDSFRIRSITFTK